LRGALKIECALKGKGGIRGKRKEEKKIKSSFFLIITWSSLAYSYLTAQTTALSNNPTKFNLN